MLGRIRCGFILLEAVVALLIVAMAAMTGLEAMQMLQGAVQRSRQTAERNDARRNAIAIVRHAARSAKAEGGSVAYGDMLVTWQAARVAAYEYRLQTAVGLTPPATAAINRLTVVTTRGGALIDRFEVFDVAPAANTAPASPLGQR